MHETGVIRRLIEVALAEAARRGGRLAAIHIRMGALAGGTASHLREHFEREAKTLGAAPLRLAIEEDPAHPAGVELTAIEVAR